MKKLSLYLLLLVFALLPLKAFAAVDITLEDKSTTTQKSVDILVNTGTDTTEKVGFQIQASEGVTISSISDDQTICSSFAYTNVSNLLTITCTLTEAKVLNGNVATILFAPNSEDYTFTVSKTTGLDLGTLTLGTVTDITATEVTTTAEPTTTAAPTTTAEPATKSFQDMLTDYLPYILIGGATILLISILGILLSKKKDSKPEEVVTQVEEKVEEIAPAPSDTRPTDIDNISGNLYSPQIKEETIQEKLEEAPMQQQTAEAPSPAVESNDLADLMAKESSPVVEEIPAFAPVEETPTETVPPVVEEVTPAPMSDFNSMPTETVPTVVEEITPAPVSDFNPMPTETVPPVVEETTPMPDYNSLPSNLPDMQQMVNNGVQETPVEETPTEEPQSVPPVQPSI